MNRQRGGGILVFPAYFDFLSVEGQRAQRLETTYHEIGRNVEVSVPELIRKLIP